MAKVVRSAGGQAVELPEGYRFDDSEVRISRDGDRVVLEPIGSAIDAETGLPLARLRALAREGIDSGPAEPWDAAAMKREMRARRG